jgi:histone deacetylase complex subunit SAP18
LLEDADGGVCELREREKEERTLDELRFVPGDYLLVLVILPSAVAMPSEIGQERLGVSSIWDCGIGATTGEKNGWRKNGDVGGSWGHAGGGPGGARHTVHREDI